MATIVGAIGLPHNPNFPELVSREGMNCETAQSYQKAAAELEDLRPDVIVIFTTDHLNTFFFENLPILALGLGDDRPTATAHPALTNRWPPPDLPDRASLERLVSLRVRS